MIYSNCTEVDLGLQYTYVGYMVKQEYAHWLFLIVVYLGIKYVMYVRMRGKDGTLSTSLRKEGNWNH